MVGQDHPREYDTFDLRVIGYLAERGFHVQAWWVHDELRRQSAGVSPTSMPGIFIAWFLAHR